MVFLVYVSSAVKLFSDEELVQLLEASRENNSKIGVTGMLLYKEGNFMQLIEGPEESVRSLHAKISIDPRHSVLDFEKKSGKRQPMRKNAWLVENGRFQPLAN